MSAMRVLWLIDSLTLGGAEALVPTFARAVDPERVRLQVAFLKSLGGNPFERELLAAGVPLTHLRARHLRDVGAFRRLVRLVREQRIEVIHAHLTYAAIWGGLCARVTGVPMVATLHTAPSEAPRWSREDVRERLFAFALNRWCSSVVAVSEAARAQHVRRGRIDSHRICVLHNGVDLEAFAADPARRRAARAGMGLGSEPLVLTVSALREGKGMEVLLPAMAALIRERPELRLAIAGEGRLRTRLQDLAAENGLNGHVRWLGLRRDVPELMAAADLFVLASRHDAFPTAVLEAMAAGLPVVATRVGGVPEIVEEGRTGLLVGPGDPAELAAAIRALIDDPHRAAALAAAARERVRERFGARAWSRRLQDLYGRAIEGRRRETMGAGAR
jgi:glycosyltransferase involved in cell wall biosynthesis